MRLALKLVFAAIFAAMVYITTTASMEQNVIDAMFGTPAPIWFTATLFDTYFAFLTIYFWVFYKESCWVSRTFWFFAIMLLGNLAISAYLLIQLFRLAPGEPVSSILLRK